MHNHRSNFIFLILIIFSLFFSSPLFGRDDWITESLAGFTFQYPISWEYEYIGEESIGIATAQLVELKYTNELECAIRYMLIPDFTLDLSASGISFKDFVLLIFKQALKKQEEKDLEIEEFIMEMEHGEVPAFKVLYENAMENKSILVVGGGTILEDAAVIVFWGINCDLDKGILAEVNAGIMHDVVKTLTFPSRIQ